MNDLNVKPKTINILEENKKLLITLNVAVIFFYSYKIINIECFLKGIFCRFGVLGGGDFAYTRSNILKECSRVHNERASITTLSVAK